MESAGELAWFRGEVLRSIVRPRSFARSLASEHFGLAGVLIVVGAGIALSLTIDALVLATKGLSPESFVARLIFESFLLGARLAVSAAVVASGVFLGDQVSRIGMTAYAMAPELASPLSATPAQGRRYDFDEASLTVPEDWTYSVRGIAGEIAHFETASATLNVAVLRPEDLATIDSFADQIARSERLGFSAARNERSVERINGVVAVDDRADGMYEARHIALRQFAILVRTEGMALQFRFFDPPDADAAL